jgi:ubiquinone/menaquinone biosynthesis C-methylase UbiE
VTWQIFEHAAAGYEGWYTTRRGHRADLAERVLLAWLMERFRDARTAVEIGCGTGHFIPTLAEAGLNVMGLDRAPAMLADARLRLASMAFVLADAQSLPFRDRSIDLVVFVTTLEFLDNPVHALREAVRVSRQGVVAMVLNRWSVGGFSRRWGPRSHGALLGQARDYSLRALRRDVKSAAECRLRGVHWASTLFPDGLWRRVVPLPLGDVIGLAALLESRAG